MTDLKNNLQADAVGYLYRAALSMAKGDTISALKFLEKSTKKIPADELVRIQPLLENPQEHLVSAEQKRFWAEKILDEYRILFNQLQE